MALVRRTRSSLKRRIISPLKEELLISTVLLAESFFPFTYAHLSGVVESTLILVQVSK